MNATPQTRELNVLQLCARTRLTPSIKERLESLLDNDLDWQHLLKLAAFHRMQPLLYQSLARVNGDALPSEVIARLHRAQSSAAMRNLMLLKEMERLLASMDARGIPAIGFKGPVLADRAYGNLGSRPSGDIDILIPPDAFRDVEDLLTADAGYVHSPKTEDLHGLRKSAHLYLSRQCAFVRPPAYAVDVHTRVMPPGYYPLGFKDLWQRSEMLSIAGAEVRAFSPEDLLLILCFHGVKNRWEALKHVCDIAEVVRAHPDMDWAAVRSRARSSKSERILDLGLYMAHHVLDTPIPHFALERAEQDRYVRSIAADLEAYLRRSHSEVLSYNQRTLFHLKVQDSLATKVRYLLYTLFRRL